MFCPGFCQFLQHRTRACFCNYCNIAILRASTTPATCLALSDGDFVIAYVNYLCDGMKVQMRSVRSNPLRRSLINATHLEDGYLDHSKRRRRRSCTVVVSRRWAAVAEAASVTRTRRARWLRTTPLRCRSGGGNREETSDDVTGWARSRRHGGAVKMGRCTFGCIHHTSVENQPSADDVGWAGRLGGGRRVRLG